MLRSVAFSRRRNREGEREHRPPTASLRPFKTVVWTGLKYTEANAKGHNSLDARIERSILGAICQKIDRRTGPDTFPPLNESLSPVCS